MIKTKVVFWRAGFYLANQSNLKDFQKALIGWKKAGPSKKPLLFDHVNRLLICQFRPIFLVKTFFELLFTFRSS